MTIPAGFRRRRQFRAETTAFRILRPSPGEAHLTSWIHLLELGYSKSFEITTRRGFTHGTTDRESRRESAGNSLEPGTEAGWSAHCRCRRRLLGIQLFDGLRE